MIEFLEFILYVILGMLVSLPLFEGTRRIAIKGNIPQGKYLLALFVVLICLTIIETSKV